MEQLKLLTEKIPPKRRGKPSSQEYEALARTRLSKHYILRDFLFSIESSVLGFSNYPEHPQLVIDAGRAICEKVLEPIHAQFGRPALTFGYMSRQTIEFGMTDAERDTNPHSSNPHNWDRQTWGDEVYARVDILPFCVEDGDVTKEEFARWCMMNLDIDLLMQWTKSNGACITISPKPRRIWLEWGSPKNGEPRQRMIMGADYWNRIYPNLPENERPKFAPSHTGGSMYWRR